MQEAVRKPTLVVKPGSLGLYSQLFGDVTQLFGVSATIPDSSRRDEGMVGVQGLHTEAQINVCDFLKEKADASSCLPESCFFFCRMASLDPSNCSQPTKDILYPKAKRAFSGKRAEFPAYYILIKPYLGKQKRWPTKKRLLFSLSWAELTSVKVHEVWQGPALHFRKHLLAGEEGQEWICLPDSKSSRCLYEIPVNPKHLASCPFSSLPLDGRGLF